MSASSFAGLPDCHGTQWISVAMPYSRRLRALLFIRLASLCPGPGSRCALSRDLTWECLKTATVRTPCFCKVSLFSIARSSPSANNQSSASKTSTSPVPREPWLDLHSILCEHPSAAPSWPSSERNPVSRCSSDYSGVSSAARLAVCLYIQKLQ